MMKYLQGLGAHRKVHNSLVPSLSLLLQLECSSLTAGSVHFSLRYTAFHPTPQSVHILAILNVMDGCFYRHLPIVDYLWVKSVTQALAASHFLNSNNLFLSAQLCFHSHSHPLCFFSFPALFNKLPFLTFHNISLLDWKADHRS